VEVVALRGDVFYGNLVVEVNGELMEIDSRPSDAIALAVRAHVPILSAVRSCRMLVFLPRRRSIQRLMKLKTLLNPSPNHRERKPNPLSAYLYLKTFWKISI